MPKYKITNPSYGIYNVFSCENNKWVIHNHIPDYSFRLTTEFTSLDEAKKEVEYLKGVAQRDEDERRKKEAWVPMKDIIYE